MRCWRHRFTNQYDAAFWGPAYQCPRCGWWHIRFIELRDVPWSKVGFWLAVTWCSGYVVWIVVNIFIEWNWPHVL